MTKIISSVWVMVNVFIGSFGGSDGSSAGSYIPKDAESVADGVNGVTVENNRCGLDLVEDHDLGLGCHSITSAGDLSGVRLNAVKKSGLCASFSCQ